MFTVIACGPAGDGRLAVTELRAFAPLPGTSMGVAYFSISNPGDAPRRLVRVSSLQFGAVHMHETITNGDTTSMRALDGLDLGSGETVAFAAGGKHLMLMQPTAGAGVGSRVTFDFHFEDGLILTVSSELLSRLDEQR